MVGVDRDGEVVRHLSVELAHAPAARLGHLLHASHELVLRDHHRSLVGRHGLERDVVVNLVVLGHLALENGRQHLLLALGERHLDVFLLLDQLVDHVAVDAHEARLLVLRLVPVDVVAVQLAVHHQHVVPLAFGRFEERVLLHGIVHIEEHHRLVLVGLVLLHLLDVLFGGEILTFDILPEHDPGGLLGELLVGENAVLDEDLQVVPLRLVVRAHGREQLLQAVCDFAGDVARNLLHVGVALQVAARDVERDVRRVDHAVQQRQVLRHDALDLVRHVDLVRIELDLVLLDLEVVVDFREVENARQVERIVDVQVDREQRLVAHRVEFVVELLVLLFGDVGGLAGPQRLDVVDDVVLVGVDVLAVLPLLDLAEGDGHGQEAAVLLQQGLDLGILGVFERILREVQHDGRAAVAGLVGLLHLELGRPGAAPVHGLGALAEGPGEYLDLVGDHERGVESQSEVPDDGLVLILFHELLGAREGDLVDVFVDLLGRHAHAAVGHGERFLVLVGGDADRQVAQIALGLADRREGFQLLGGVHGVRNQLAQENFMVRVEEFLDDGENVLRRNSDFSVFHNCYLCCFI